MQIGRGTHSCSSSTSSSLLDGTNSGGQYPRMWWSEARRHHLVIKFQPGWRGHLHCPDDEIGPSLVGQFWAGYPGWYCLSSRHMMMSWTTCLHSEPTLGDCCHGSTHADRLSRMLLTFKLHRNLSENYNSSYDDPMYLSNLKVCGRASSSWSIDRY